MDYWGDQRVCCPPTLKLLGGGAVPPPPSSYAYDYGTASHSKFSLQRRELGASSHSTFLVQKRKFGASNERILRVQIGSKQLLYTRAVIQQENAQMCFSLDFYSL